MATRQVALLRGINVGGKNKLPMKALAAIFVEAGCTAVQTYIQSGNVIFTAPARLDVAARVSRAIKDQLAMQIPVVVRTAAQLSSAVAAYPFETDPPDPMAIMFLADEPSAAAIAGLDPQRSPPDRFQIIGREIHLHLPNGFARTKLTNDWFDRRLATVSTARNWRTVLKLQELAAGLSD
jgi:uncharacterized protein (DUF1697 family)